jgi:hypothetical protein
MSKLAHLQAFRERQKAGLRVFRVTCDAIGVECLLEASGLLPPDNDDPKLVEEALARFITIAVNEAGFGNDSDSS